jgi:hypothetical protein
VGLPAGSFAVAALVVLVLPGLILAAVRRWARGELPADRSVSLAIARGVIFSLSLACIYLVIFGSVGVDALDFSDSDTIVVREPRVVGLIVGVCFLAVPFAFAIVVHLPLIAAMTPAWAGSRAWLRWVRVPGPKYGYSDAPTAWDFAVMGNQQTLVRVKRADGEWWGGWFTRGSYATTYPEPRSIFIAHEYQMEPDGSFGEPRANQGVWLTILDSDIVEWCKPSELQATDTDRGH